MHIYADVFDYICAFVCVRKHTGKNTVSQNNVDTGHEKSNMIRSMYKENKKWQK